ncbi:MAG: hypothetical protein WC609_03590 [Candidatus Paceibacterota bacterium]|jgi:lipopolysaccharide export LptBFGC system permease protein LptF
MDQENTKKEGTACGLSKNKKIIIIAIIALLVVGFVVNGFWGRKAGERMAENILEKQLGGNVNINSKDGSVSIQSDKGSFSAGEATSWPSNMPSDIPEFTAGKLTMAASISSENNGWQVAATDVSKDDFNAYHSLLESKGWKNISFSDANIDMLQMNNGTYDLFMVFNAEDGGFSLTVSVKN